MKKRWAICGTIAIALIALGIGIWWRINNDGGIIEGIGSGANRPIRKYYSNLTGLEISDESINSAPTFCIQIPNGSTDGARPQVGLSKAGVVFEAIAETGITRFAAVFQAPDTGVIGPIRSLRPYYLEWDTPFDCTIVHDGGSNEALAAVGNGSYRNLDENFNFMWKETYINGQYRYWNNVFTSPEKLLQFNEEKGYKTSDPKVFPRLHPEEVPEPCLEECENATNIINVRFTGLVDYGVNYAYDSNSNTYLRSYQNGDAHMVYDCPAGVTNFENCGKPVQIAPSAVAVMRVQENTMQDGYHENINTVGTGVVYVFQNGEVIEGTWKKDSINRQIEFRDLEGDEIEFTPGQLWIMAVPQFGSVSWE